MIPVAKQPEPSNFDFEVRQPGNSYLANTTNPTFKGRNKHWTKAANDLNNAYNRVCAYSCLYLATLGSVDHFLPKELYPNLAYEWDNFRLAMPRMNTHKGQSIEILDPFVVQPGWFVLDFPSCLVMAGDGLPVRTMDKINKTIEVLKLNDDDVLVQERCDTMVYFAEGALTLPYLERRYPFLAREIIRQGIQSTASTIFKRRSL